MKFKSLLSQETKIMGDTNHITTKWVGNMAFESNNPSGHDLRIDAGPDDGAPPLIVSAHGGPTGMADRGLKMKIQFWTSRGFAYLDVDYTGSFGYGRTYMEALNGQWGIADVEDVEAGAKALAARGLADPNKLFISGGSAGGYTVLCALAFRDTFSAGASYYGIGDLKKLLELTHKFEAGYLHALIG